jgi:CDGSH-type Zn-finger protein
MSKIKITVRPNGPYLVDDPEGLVELVDKDGAPYERPVRPAGKPSLALCRCGASVNKPFCDGTHSKVGFQAAEAAVRTEGENK